MTVCGNCGAKIVSNAKFCPECGAKQTYPSPVEKSIQPSHCVNCGAKLEPNVNFCEQCGTRVPSTIAEKPPSVSQRIEGIDVIRILFAVSGLLPVLGIFVLNAFGMLVFPIISFMAYFLYRSKGLHKLAKVFRNMGIFQVLGLIWFFIPFGIVGNIYGIAMVIGFGIIIPLLISLAAIIDTSLLLKKVSLEKPPPGSSGVWMNCKTTGGLVEVLFPYALINDIQRRELDWDNQVFIPLEPNIQHKIAVQLHYFGLEIGRYKTFLFIQLRPSEIQNLEYKIRSFFTKPYALITKKS